ncbi:hypothetical protein F7725_003242 [Dissostichus mawsoni]|uniref:Uncharacterized protein n=1 Tax=Dissostichus mawsoni TaxID=36200 RepID=A0A7J5Y9S2_DISMA|nr:hypothetical protein F7725_003242 [Dissostichus mawsoni]
MLLQVLERLFHPRLSLFKLIDEIRAGFVLLKHTTRKLWFILTMRKEEIQNNMMNEKSRCNTWFSSLNKGSEVTARFSTAAKKRSSSSRPSRVDFSRAASSSSSSARLLTDPNSTNSTTDTSRITDTNAECHHDTTACGSRKRGGDEHLAQQERHLERNLAQVDRHWQLTMEAAARAREEEMALRREENTQTEAFNLAFLRTLGQVLGGSRHGPSPQEDEPPLNKEVDLKFVNEYQPFK